VRGGYDHLSPGPTISPRPRRGGALTADDPLALERQVCFALSVADRLVVGTYRPLLEPLGLTHPQYLVMVVLWERGPITVKELGTLLSTDSGTLSPLLRRLESAGLVARRRDGTDQRQVRVHLTAEGSALRERAVRVPGGVVERLALSEEQLRQLHGVLMHVIEAAGGVPDATEPLAE